MANIFTVDIEDWFHILDFPETAQIKSWHNFEKRVEIGTHKILKVLEKNNIQGTFFILGWIAEKYPDLVKLIADLGHDIGCHSYNHPLLYNLSETEFRNDTEVAMERIYAATGVTTKYYRAPGFSVKNENLWALEILCNLGFEVDCSIFPVGRAHGGIERYGRQMPHKIILPSGRSITELPINYSKKLGVNLVYGGGGYFRITPYFLMRRLFRSSPYNMTYFHPRDFDPGQPRLSGLSRMRKFKCYVGVTSSLKKLEKLTDEFEFCSVSQFLSKHSIPKEFDW